jgi:hypothetical protein
MKEKQLNWFKLIQVLGAIAFTLGGKLYNTNNDFLKNYPSILAVILGIALSIWGSWRSHLFVKRIDKTTSQLQSLKNKQDEHRANLNKFINTYIRIISKRFKCKETDRVSLYIRLERKNKFYLVGRFSKRESFNIAKHGDENIYPDKIGCMWEAWDKGQYLIKNIPKDPNKSKTRLKKSLHFTDVHFERRTMKSRSQYGRRIKNGDGKHIGVIVFESTNPDKNFESKVESTLFKGDYTILALQMTIYLDLLDNDTIINN